MGQQGTATSGIVAPFTGAWIETLYQCICSAVTRVAPFTGAWIETEANAGSSGVTTSRALHGRVD